MKFAYTYHFIAAIALYLVVAQAGEELFLEKQVSAAVELPATVRPGLCQVFEDYDLYDLKPLDSIQGDKDTPVVIPPGGGSKAFIYRLCGLPWAMNKSFLKLASPKSKTLPASCAAIKDAEAIYMEGGECKHAFDAVTLTGIEDKDKQKSESERNIGFTLAFASRAACKKGSKAKFKYVMKAYCQKDPKNAKYGKFGAVKYSKDGCTASVEYHGKQGCKLYTLEIEKYMAAVAPFIGAILVLFGGALAFAGAKFIYQAFAALIFLLATSLSFMLCYNFMPPDKVSAVLLGCVLVGSMVVGALVAYYTFRFAELWAVPLLAAWAGIVLGLIVAKLLEVKGGLPSLGIALAGGALGGWLGNKIEKVIRALGTAFVGSFLLVRGVACYAGGYPSEYELPAGIQKDEHRTIWMYLAGLVVLTVAGTLVQLYLVRDERKGDDDDNYMADEEARVCGCF